MTTTTVKTKGLQFKADMVRSILDGKKTMTRRLVKPQPETRCGEIEVWDKSSESRVPMDAESFANEFAPYQPGQILYVKETFCAGRPATPNGLGICVREKWSKPEMGDKVVYKASSDYGPHPPPWTSSMFMPRWAARIWIEITAVRCERLQDISEEDAEAEGVDFLRHHPDSDETLSARKLYEILWDHINKKPGTRWSDNPFVFCYAFKRTEAP